MKMSIIPDYMGSPGNHVRNLQSVMRSSERCHQKSSVKFQAGDKLKSAFRHVTSLDLLGITRKTV